MAITLVQQPQILQPAYNPNYWSFSSDNKALTGFRYIVDLYKKVDDSLIVRQRINPNITYGNCILDLSKILSTYLTNNLPTVTNPALKDEVQLSYYLKVGEEYATTWEYYDYEFYTSSDSYNGYVKLTSDIIGYMDTHTFVEGDQILIAQDDPDLTPGTLLLEGLHTVVKVIDSYSFVIDVPFSYVGSTVPGTATGSVTYADGRKTITPALYTSNYKIVFNGAANHQDFLTWNYADYNLDANTDEFLSSIPNVFTISPTASLTLNAWSYITGTSSTRKLYFENNLGTKRYCNFNIGTESRQIVTAGVGPGNMPTTTLIAGSGNIVQTGTIWYSVMITDAAYTQMSEKIYFYLDDMCSGFNNYELVFLDRMGSMGSFTFKYNKTETGSINRSTNNYVLGTFDTDWNLSSTDGITKVNDISIKERMTMHTAWLSDVEAAYFCELLSSPAVFMLIGSSFYPVVIEDTSYEIKKIKTSKNIKYSINISPSVNNQINW